MKYKRQQCILEDGEEFEILTNDWYIHKILIQEV